MALNKGRSTTLVLLRDGTLWTCGIRLGAAQPSSRFNGLKIAANRLLQHLPGHPFLAVRQFETDTVPRKLWTLPPEVIRSLGESNANTSAR
jgi:hypothetical protein